MIEVLDIGNVGGNLKRIFANKKRMEGGKFLLHLLQIHGHNEVSLKRTHQFELTSY